MPQPHVRPIDQRVQQSRRQLFDLLDHLLRLRREETLREQQRRRDAEAGFDRAETVRESRSVRRQPAALGI
ncbi:hypothetical protein D3C83_237620 [compost metagenome]